MKQETYYKAERLQERVDLYEEQLGLLMECTEIVFTRPEKTESREDDLLKIEVDAMSAYFSPLKEVIAKMIMKNLESTQKEFDELQDWPGEDQ